MAPGHTRQVRVLPQPAKQCCGIRISIFVRILYFFNLSGSSSCTKSCSAPTCYDKKFWLIIMYPHNFCLL
jgi:hypothetical protein